jgi:exodeoxyribonuclease VII small subunit
MAAPKKSYADISSELDDVLLQLESENIDVDTATKLYEQGLKLVEELESRLQSAEIKIRELKVKED